MFNSGDYFTNNEQFEWDPNIFGIPLLATKTALIDHLFYDKPIWRSPWFMNDKSKTNSSMYTLPNFQLHEFPQMDSLYTQFFFYLILARVDPVITSEYFFQILMERAKTNDRHK